MTDLSGSIIGCKCMIWSNYEFESVPGFLTGSIIATSWFCFGEASGTVHSGMCKFHIYQCQMAIVHVKLPIWFLQMCSPRNIPNNYVDRKAHFLVEDHALFLQKMRGCTKLRGSLEGAVAMALRAVACKRREAVRTTTSP